MGAVTAWGIDVALPPGWDARLYRRPPADPVEQTWPILHAANFPLPPQRGDFGAGIVEAMGPLHLFVALLEYGGDSVGTPLFAASGMPRRLAPSDFRPDQLQRGIPGQAGVQRFFTEAGRAFCLYAVLGSLAARYVLIGKVNALLSAVAVAPGGASG